MDSIYAQSYRNLQRSTLGFRVNSRPKKIRSSFAPASLQICPTAETVFFSPGNRGCEFCRRITKRLYAALYLKSRVI